MKNNQLFTLLCLIVFASLLASCGVNKSLYEASSVPEEGGVRFTKLTQDNEKVYGPKVSENNGTLQWYASSLIDVSKDGKLFAYLAESNKNVNIFIRSTESGVSTVQRTFRNVVLDMGFSPDGKYIAFCDNRDGEENIYMINTREGTSIQQITSASRASESGPCFSPDGKLIFFSKEEGDQDEKGRPITRYYIWSFNRETSLLTQHGEGLTPNVSPDGKKLAITRINKTTGRGEIWIIDLQTDQESLILSSDKIGYSTPQFSPDGKRLAVVFTSLKRKNMAANLDIGLVNVDGTHFTQLTFHPGSDVSPRWSPDGQSLYFLSTRGNSQKKYNVWVMNVKS